MKKSMCTFLFATPLLVLSIIPAQTLFSSTQNVTAAGADTVIYDNKGRVVQPLTGPNSVLNTAISNSTDDSGPSILYDVDGNLVMPNMMPTTDPHGSLYWYIEAKDDGKAATPRSHTNDFGLV